MRTTAVNTLVNWAINKDYEYRHQLAIMPTSRVKKAVKFIAKQPGDWARFLGNQYANMTKGEKFTMSSTEAYVRSLSFAIGLNKAQDAGLIRNDIEWYDFLDETKWDSVEEMNAEVAKAVDIGRRFSEFTNFGLSTQQVGRWYYGGFGALMGKFTVWKNQKAGRDLDIIKYGYTSLKSWEKIENDNFDVKAVAKLFKELIRIEQTAISSDKEASSKKRTKSKRRVVNNRLQTLKTLVSMQGLPTILWDAFMQAPIGLGGLKKMLWGGMGGRAVRSFQSDVISLMFSPLTLAIRLFLTNPFDEEDLEKTWTYYMRRLWLGYVPMVMWDGATAGVMLARDNVRHMWRKIPVPAPYIMQPAIKGGAEGLINWLLDVDERTYKRKRKEDLFGRDRPRKN